MYESDEGGCERVSGTQGHGREGREAQCLTRCASHHMHSTYISLSPILASTRFESHLRRLLEGTNLTAMVTPVETKLKDDKCETCCTWATAAHSAILCNCNSTSCNSITSYASLMPHPCNHFHSSEHHVSTHSIGTHLGNHRMPSYNRSYVHIMRCLSSEWRADAVCCTSAWHVCDPPAVCCDCMFVDVCRRPNTGLYSLKNGVEYVPRKCPALMR